MEWSLWIHRAERSSRTWHPGGGSGLNLPLGGYSINWLPDTRHGEQCALSGRLNGRRRLCATAPQAAHNFHGRVRHEPGPSPFRHWIPDAPPANRPGLPFASFVAGSPASTTLAPSFATATRWPRSAPRWRSYPAS